MAYPSLASDCFSRFAYRQAEVEVPKEFVLPFARNEARL